MKDVRLYEMIEKAVAENKPILLPPDLAPNVKMMSASIGEVFTLTGIYWMDDKRNIYEPWFRAEYRASKGSVGFYVKGSCTPDLFSSGDTSMFKPENRYYTIV